MARYFCDRRNCPRRRKGSQAMLERMGMSATLRDSKDNSMDPFCRRDHFKIHQCDVHSEPISCIAQKRSPIGRRAKYFMRVGGGTRSVWTGVFLGESSWACTCGLALDRDVISLTNRKIGEARLDSQAVRCMIFSQARRANHSSSLGDALVILPQQGRQTPIHHVELCCLSIRAMTSADRPDGHGRCGVVEASEDPPFRYFSRMMRALGKAGGHQPVEFGKSQT